MIITYTLEDTENADNGWSPVFALVTDGARRVLQVTTWTGGTGTAPASGKYVGASGLVTLAADAVDVRGGTGATGAAGADGDDAYVYIAYASDDTGTGFTTTFNASLNYIAVKTTTSPIASPAVGDFAGLWKNYKGATGATGSTGETGADAWSPIFAVVTDTERRVLQVSGWTGGEGTPPASGQFVGAAGFVALAADAVDIRGDTGAAGSNGTNGSNGLLSAADATWSAMTGTADKAADATYDAPGISDPPTQAEVAAMSTHLQYLSRRMKALTDSLLAATLPQSA